MSAPVINLAAARAERHHLRAVVEDVEWMLATGENLIGVMRRLGYRHEASLERLLLRAGRGELMTQLRDRAGRWTAA